MERNGRPSLYIHIACAMSFFCHHHVDLETDYTAGKRFTSFSSRFACLPHVTRMQYARGPVCACDALRISMQLCAYTDHQTLLVLGSLFLVQFVRC